MYVKTPELRDQYRDYIPVYTDGSQDGNSRACATHFQSDTVIITDSLLGLLNLDGHTKV